MATYEKQQILDSVARLNDADSPDSYAIALHNLLDAIYEDCQQSGSDCEAAWQQRQAAQPWRKLASRIDRWIKGLER